MTASVVAEGQPVAVVVSAYEALRQQATEQGGHPQRELGLALLMRQGVAAWLHAYCHAAPKPLPRSGETATLVPAGIRGELTLILAGMALGAGTKGASA
jgi:hypothetical protein